MPGYQTLSTHLHNEISAHDNLADFRAIHACLLETTFCDRVLLAFGDEPYNSNVIRHPESVTLSSLLLIVVVRLGIQKVL